MKIKHIIISLTILIIGCDSNNQSTHEQNLGLNIKGYNVALADSAIKVQIKKLQKNDFNLKSLNDALKIANEIINTFPDSVNYLKFKGKILLWMKDYKTYISFCEKTMNKYTDKASIYGSIGHAFYLLGDSLTALNFYNKSIIQYDKQIKKTKNTQMMFNRAFMFNFTEGKKKAITELEKYRKQYPEDFYLNGPVQLFYEFDKKTYFEKITQKGNGLN